MKIPSYDELVNTPILRLTPTIADVYKNRCILIIFIDDTVKKYDLKFWNTPYESFTSLDEFLENTHISITEFNLIYTIDYVLKTILYKDIKQIYVTNF